VITVLRIEARTCPTQLPRIGAYHVVAVIAIVHAWGTMGEHFSRCLAVDKVSQLTTQDLELTHYRTVTTQRGGGCGPTRRMGHGQKHAHLLTRALKTYHWNDPVVTCHVWI
jgi:hypothetical protein